MDVLVHLPDPTELTLTLNLTRTLTPTLIRPHNINFFLEVGYSGLVQNGVYGAAASKNVTVNREWPEGYLAGHFAPSPITFIVGAV